MIRYAFIDLGLVPEAASSYLLAQTVGPRRAAELFMLNEKVSGEQAAEMGLVNAVLPPGELQDYAWSKAEEAGTKTGRSYEKHQSPHASGSSSVCGRTAWCRAGLFEEHVRGDESRAIFEAFLNRG